MISFVISFVRSSLSCQFLLISFPVLLTGMLAIGYLTGKQVENRALQRMGGVTRLYVDSFVAPHAQNLIASDDLREADRAALDALRSKTPLGSRNQRVDEVMLEISAAQHQSWLVVVPTTAVMYLLLFILVRRGCQTIDQQRRELNEKVAQLTALNAQHVRVWRAAASTTALNEIFLRRISADLHDGPGQDLGFALMRFESISDICSKCPGGKEGRMVVAAALRPINSAIQSALADLRLISADLRMPEIDRMSLNEIAARAVRDYESKTGVNVVLLASVSSTAASLPVKIALYRLLQEALANGFRHAAGAGQRVDIRNEDRRLLVEISDKGPGFDQHAAIKEGHIGLFGMRERVELLGGSFDLQSKPGLGTVIRLNLPMLVPEMEYE